MYAERKAAEAAACGDSARAAYWTRIKEVVDQAPPLSAEQVARLQILMRPDFVRDAPEPRQLRTQARRGTSIRNGEGTQVAAPTAVAG